MGFVQWFPMGNKKLVEETVRDMNEIGARYLRTGFSWADWESPGGKEWYEWLYPRLFEEGFDILPNFLYIPPNKALPDKEGNRRTSHPPEHPEDYATFVEDAINALGHTFTHAELLNEPHLKQEWNSDLDPDFSIFTATVKAGAKKARELGKKTVLAGTVIHHPDWLLDVVKQGILEDIDIIGMHAFPYFKWGAKHSDKPVWRYAEDFKRSLESFGFHGPIWLTETGFPTEGDPNASEERQAEIFSALLRQDIIPRAYWWSLRDLPPDIQSYTESQIGFREPVFYHFGLKTHEGNPKLLYRLIAHQEVEGVESLSRAA